MIALVTGANGFLGSKLVRYLLDRGHEVRGVVRKQTFTPCEEKQLIWIERDLSIHGLTPEELDGAEVLFHLAATKQGDDERKFLADNETAMVNLLKSCAGLVGKVIYASSQVVYGDVNNLAVNEKFPLDGSDNPYACSKVNCENWLRWFQKKSQKRFLSLRFTGFIEDGSVVNYFIDCAQKNEPIELYSNGDVCRDYIIAEDGVHALMRAAEYNGSIDGVGVFNIGSGQAIPVYEIARIVCEELGSKSRIIPLDKAAPKANFVFDIKKACTELGFEPAVLIDAVRDYVRDKVIRNGNDR